MKFARDSENVGARIFAAASYLTFGRVVVRSFSLLNLAVLGRLLTPEDYGIAALAFTTIGMLLAITEISVASALLASDDIDRRKLDTAFSLSIGRGVILAVLIFAAAGPIAIMLEVPELEMVMRVLALVALIEGFGNPAFLLYERNLDYSRVFWRDAFAAGISSAVTIAIAVYTRNYWALVVGMVLATTLRVASTYWRIGHRPGFSLHHWRDLLGFGVWVTLESICQRLMDYAPNVIITKMISATGVGQFAVGLQTSSMLLKELIAPLSRTLFPGFSAIKHDRARLLGAYRASQAFILGLALPLGAGLALYSVVIIRVLVGEGWGPAAQLLQIIGPATALLMPMAAAHSLLMALGEVRRLFQRRLFDAVMIWPLLVAGAYYDGFRGVVLGYAISQLLSLAIMLLLTRRVVSERILGPFVANWRSIAAVIAMTLALHAMFDPLSFGGAEAQGIGFLLVGVAIGAAIYALTLLVLWRLSGKPKGFETIIIDKIGELMGHIARRNR